MHRLLPLLEMIVAVAVSTIATRVANDLYDKATRQHRE